MDDVKNFFKERFNISTTRKPSTSRDHSQDSETSKQTNKSKGKQQKGKASKKGTQPKQQTTGNNNPPNRKVKGKQVEHSITTSADDGWENCGAGSYEGYYSAEEDISNTDTKVNHHEKHSTSKLDNKSDGWKSTTGHAAEFIRDNNRSSKHSVDSGFGGSFRKSNRRMSRRTKSRSQTEHSEHFVSDEMGHLKNKTAALNLSRATNDTNKPHRLRTTKVNKPETEVQNSEATAEMVQRRERNIRHKGAATSSEESDDDESAIIVDLHRDLKRALRESKVRYYMINHDHDDETKIVIEGCNVVGVHGKLKEVLQAPNYNRFSLTTRDIVLGHPECGLPTLGLWVRLHRPMRCSLSKIRRKPISVIELLLKGFDNRRAQRSNYDYYGATTAHSLMTPEQCEILSNSSQEFKRVWDELVEENWNSKQFMEVPANSPIDITSRPFPLFRHWFPAGRDDDSFIMNDIVIFKLDENHLKDDRWLTQVMSSQYGRTVEDDPISPDLEHIDINKIYNIKSRKGLAKLRGRRIICAGKTGKIVMSPPIEQDGGELGLYLAFVLDGNDTLVDGDCGSLVYMFREVENVEDVIVGMFFGTLIRDPLVHQATILSLTLKQFENMPDFHIEGLLPIHSTKQPPSRHHDSGYRSSHESSSVSVAHQTTMQTDVW